MTKKKTATAGKKKKLAFNIDKDKIAKPVRVHFETKKHTRKPGFEQALAEVQAEREPAHPEPTSQAPDATDNLGRLDRELSKAPQALAPVLKIPFSIWAKVSEIPEMKLSDAEAEEWAEPIVALLEYYFPGKIPEVIWIWLMFLSATEKVIDSRVKIRYEKRQERNHPGTAPKREPAASLNTTSQPAPKHNGAEPAEGFPQE